MQSPNDLDPFERAAHRSPGRLRRRAGLTLAVTALWVTAACGEADTDSGPSGVVNQTIEITATEYAFAADATATIAPGETVQFRLVNQGDLVHELQILDESGRLIDRVERLDPGASGTVNIEFADPGVYQFICDVDDHLSRGQRATFRVSDPVAE